MLQNIISNGRRLLLWSCCLLLPAAEGMELGNWHLAVAESLKKPDLITRRTDSGWWFRIPAVEKENRNDLQLWSFVELEPGREYQLSFDIESAEAGELAYSYRGKDNRFYANFTSVSVPRGKSRVVRVLKVKEEKRPAETALHLWLGTLRGELKIGNIVLKDMKEDTLSDFPGNYAPPYRERRQSPLEQVKTEVNFWQGDRLNVPNPAESRNLLANPSFEAGFRYYTFPNDIGSYIPGYEEKYSIDAQESKFGGRSLKIKAINPPHPEDMIRSFGYPVRAGKVYTLSFYAKASREGIVLSTHHTPANFYIREQYPKVSQSAFELSREWRRYTVRVQSNSTGYAFSFRLRENLPAEAAWIDAIQFEEGESATEYTEKPLTLELKTVAAGNFLTPGDNPDSTLRIITPEKNTEGRLSLTVEDFFYHRTPLGDFTFRTDERGEAEIALPLSRHFTGRTGVFMIRAEGMAAGKTMVDYIRFSIMEPETKRRRNSSILGYHQLVVPNFETAMRRWRAVGIGSTNYFYYNFHNELLFRLLEKYGIEDTCAPLRQQWDVKLKSGETIRRGDAISIQPAGPRDVNTEVLVQGWKSWKGVTPEQLKAFEEAAFRYARHHHWRKAFSLDHEMHNEMLDHGNYDDFAWILIACAKGVKRANPANQTYLEGGAANLYAGIALTENLLAAVNRVEPGFRFDRFAVHAYGHPENEEFDELIGRYIDVLVRYGYRDVPLYINEGGYYSPFVIPEWGLTPYRPFLMDHYHLWGISYDMGWGERASAAFTVRSWLLAMKFRQIRQFNQWRPFIYLDCDLTPLAIQKAANTLSRMVGDAGFERKIVFAADCIAYLFRDADGTPVAVLWTYDPDIDQGKREPLTMTLEPCGTVEAVFDLMEEKREVAAAETRLQLPLSPFPLFIRGKKGEFDRFAEVINSITVAGEPKPPVRGSSRLADAGSASLQLRNLLTRDFTGELKVSAGKWTEQQHLKLAGLETRAMRVPLPEPAVPGKITDSQLNWEITAGEKTYRGSIPQHTFAIPVAPRISLTGNLAEWQDVPAISLTNLRRHSAEDRKEFSASYRTAWDANGFYLLVEVNDDKLFYGAPVRNSAQGTSCDTLIVYFDTLSNGKDKTTLRVDSDDYYYLFMPRPDEKRALVYTQEAASQQLSIGVGAIQPKMYINEVKTFFGKTEKGYFYEIAFPPLTVRPIRLEPGASFGFGLLVWDQDGDREPSRSLNLAWPQGASCWRSPQTWAQAILQPSPEAK